MNVNLLYSLPEDLKDIIVPMCQKENLKNLLNSNEFKKRTNRIPYQITVSIKQLDNIYLESRWIEKHRNVFIHSITFELTNYKSSLVRCFRQNSYNYRTPLNSISQLKKEFEIPCC